MATDFDAGINSSNAWTASLDDSEDQLVVKQARALYAFDGQEEFRELRGVAPGDDLEIIKEDLPDGWSLVRTVADGQIGLLPRSYYTFIADFVSQPPEAQTQRTAITPQTTGEWLGPLQSLIDGISRLNRFSNFVTSGAESWLLNGAPEPPQSSSSTDNPDNTTVSHLNDDDEDESGLHLGNSEADRHFIDTGPSWKSKIPPFKILVHSPSKRTSVLSGAYTIYTITSLFSPSDPYTPPYTSHHNRLHSDFIPRSMRRFSLNGISEEGDNIPEDEEHSAQPKPLQRLTVHRRFSHFLTLHTILLRRLPGLALPPLPPKQYTNRFSSTFIEARRADLERYLTTLIRHPIIRYTDILTFFLSCESDTQFHALLPKFKALPPVGPQFYAKVYHPVFNLDVEDAREAGEGFEGHVKSVKRSVQGLRGLFGRVREARVEMAKMERSLGYAILGMITPPRQELDGVDGEDDGEEGEREGGESSGRSKGKGKQVKRNRGIVNSSGAWCWREDCKECLHLTKGLQKFSDTLQSVADLYDDHARRTQLATHESLKSMAHPDTIYAPVLDTHNATLSRYQSALADSSNDSAKADLASRCETVLNTTMSELDIYHTQKVEDFHRFGVEHLDGEIQLYEQILTRLRTARSILTSPPSPPDSELHTTKSVTPSIYARDLFPSSPLPTTATSTSRFYPYSNSKLITTSHKFIPSSSTTGGTVPGIGEVQIPALPMPAPHVFDGIGWNASLV
ncbi:hypothetical protein D9756_006532 [Leucocoprinus leucothites]|uniref:Uncharacterized protein n=1 Tax=Leucocoprinus leucothites TaxID=201217 RepID=A0A8H5G297_9AGAR|nr:hypothetical protein D9756_006532 [Leucoagaricus leucothites]